MSSTKVPTCMATLQGARFFARAEIMPSKQPPIGLVTIEIASNRRRNFESARVMAACCKEDREPGCLHQQEVQQPVCHPERDELSSVCRRRRCLAPGHLSQGRGMVDQMSVTLSAINSTARRSAKKPALYVGLAGDAPHTAPARISLAGVDRLDVGRGDKRTVTRQVTNGLTCVVVTLADARLSSQHARLSRIDSAWVAEDLKSKNGTLIGRQRITRHCLADGDAILVGHSVLVFRDHGGDGGDCDGAPAAPATGFTTMSSTLATQFAELALAARSSVPIEITGESGTGKELAARAVHALSGRGGKFAAINCGALPSSLLEGELFGHKKGAYTGAVDDRLGLVRSADRGTLFLDEIAELPAASQAALLRVLQEGEVMPLGGDRAVKVDLRVVTATHKDLDAEVAANRFRADLRARLLGVQFALPPLRRRLEDLGLLITMLLGRLAPGREVRFSADAVAALYAYDWPLNIRELERALAAALAVAHDRIELRHLPPALRPPASASGIDASQATITGPVVARLRSAAVAPGIDLAALSIADRAIHDQLVAALERHGWNLAAVARELKKDRTQIRRWMKRFGLSRDAAD